MAERKGQGHPDTICDAIAEEVSRALSLYYLENFGSVYHHNVDKALLVGGQSHPRYGGGTMLQPIELYIAGRATADIGGTSIPVDDIAVSAAQKWITENLRYIDISRHINIIPRIRPGSTELVKLFERFGKGEVPLANDTSFGVGYYPNSGLEQSVLDIESWLNSEKSKINFPWIGEDVKVMGINDNGRLAFTISIAMVDRFISDVQDYIFKVEQIKSGIFQHVGICNAEVYINAADNYPEESLYMTVTGTSAEAGDDGQVGRGNRLNGLITPCRPMSLEAVSGKNPVSHVGKIYNYFAFELSREIVESKMADEASVYIVSQIGSPITEPKLLSISVINPGTDQQAIYRLAEDKLKTLPHFWRKILLH